MKVSTEYIASICVTVSKDDSPKDLADMLYSDKRVENVVEDFDADVVGLPLVECGCVEDIPPLDELQIKMDEVTAIIKKYAPEAATKLQLVLWSY